MAGQRAAVLASFNIRMDRIKRQVDVFFVGEWSLAAQTVRARCATLGENRALESIEVIRPVFYHTTRAYLVGRTPVGRVTVAVLNINDPFRVELRQRLIDEGLFPPA